MAKRGRKGFMEEEDAIKIATLSSATLKRYLNAVASGQIPITDGVKVALQVVLKRMPDKVQAEGFEQIFQVVINEAKKGNRLSSVEQVHP